MFSTANTILHDESTGAIPALAALTCILVNIEAPAEPAPMEPVKLLGGGAGIDGTGVTVAGGAYVVAGDGETVGVGETGAGGVNVAAPDEGAAIACE